MATKKIETTRRGDVFRSFEEVEVGKSVEERFVDFFREFYGCMPQDRYSGYCHDFDGQRGFLRVRYYTKKDDFFNPTFSLHLFPRDEQVFRDIIDTPLLIIDTKRPEIGVAQLKVVNFEYGSFTCEIYKDDE